MLFKKGVADESVREETENENKSPIWSTDVMANWNVKLEVLFNYNHKIDGETGRYYHTYKPTQFEFTFAEALKYISENEKYYEVNALLMHNVVIRDAMRKLGVTPVVEHIKTFAPNDEKLLERLNSFQSAYPNGSIGNIDIQVYSVYEEVKILGHTFHGLNDIMDYVEMSLNDKSSSEGKVYSRTPKKEGDVHVGEVWASYPCFDSEDYANETRTYQNYIVRSKPIVNEDLQKLKALPSGINYERVSENVPLSMLPMVYYKGDGCYMLVATGKTEKR